MHHPRDRDFKSRTGLPRSALPRERSGVPAQPECLLQRTLLQTEVPNVLSSIQNGQFASGFDHFEKVGCKSGLQPQWFFNSAWYVDRNPDLTPEALQENRLNDPYCHFLPSGLNERRPGNWFHAALNKVGNPEIAPTTVNDLRAWLLDPAALARWLYPLFNSSWFAAKYNTFGDALLDIERYILTAGRDRLSPNPAFDEAYYQENYPNVGTAIADGTFSSGFEHFVQFGMAEGRRPLRNFDPHYYLSANPGVVEDCRREGLTPFYHFLRYRSARPVKIEPSFGERPITEEAGKGMFERRAAVNATLPVVLPEHEQPELSVVFIARNKYEQTYASIASLDVATSRSYEVIVYDNGSTDGVKDIARSIPGVRTIRSETNKGFTIAVNEAAAIARGRYLVLANNDIELARGSLDAAVRRLDGDPTIGIVGGRIIRSHGMLQEAGSIIWKDGSCLGYGRDLDPSDGRVTFPLDVDFCSGCLLVMLLEDWKGLGGFDTVYAPAYYEETDFCLRMWAAGKRVVYDPAVVLWHFEFGSSTLPDDPLALMRRNQQALLKKHAATLARHMSPHPAHVERARFRRVKGPRVLFVEDSIPNSGRGMGFVRSSHIVELLSDIAGLVTLVGLHPVSGQRHPAWDSASKPLELMWDLNHTDMVRFLRDRIGLYDHLWLSRTHNLPYLRKWKAEVPEFFEGLSVTVDTEAIAAARVAHQARLLGETLDEAELASKELAGIELVSNICVVNTIDRALVEAELRNLGASPSVIIMGHTLPVRAPLPRFEETRNIAIVGSFGNVHGPNVDALRWFDREVRPRLHMDFDAVRFIIAGHKADQIHEAVRERHGYEIMSDIPDMGDLYRTLRISLAPTRFAGGIPFKVHEAASYGVPVVMSELLARQLGWNEEPLLGMAPGGSSDEVAHKLNQLYFDGEAWYACQRRQAELIARDCSDVLFQNGVRTCLGQPLLEVAHVEPVAFDVRAPARRGRRPVAVAS